MHLRPYPWKDWCFALWVTDAAFTPNHQNFRNTGGVRLGENRFPIAPSEGVARSPSNLVQTQQTLLDFSQRPVLIPTLRDTLAKRLAFLPGEGRMSRRGMYGYLSEMVEDSATRLLQAALQG